MGPGGVCIRVSFLRDINDDLINTGRYLSSTEERDVARAGTVPFLYVCIPDRRDQPSCAIHFSRLGVFLTPSINEELREPPYRRTTPRPLLLEAQPLI